MSGLYTYILNINEIDFNKEKSLKIAFKGILFMVLRKLS